MPRQCRYILSFILFRTSSKRESRRSKNGIAKWGKVKKNKMVIHENEIGPIRNQTKL